MFVVVEDFSYVDENGEIVKVDVTARRSIFDNIEMARDLAMNLALAYGMREEAEIISDYECSYMFCGHRSFSKFSVAKLEIVE